MRIFIPFEIVLHRDYFFIGSEHGAALSIGKGVWHPAAANDKVWVERDGDGWRGRFFALEWDVTPPAWWPNKAAKASGV